MSVFRNQFSSQFQPAFASAFLSANSPEWIFGEDNAAVIKAAFHAVDTASDGTATDMIKGTGGITSVCATTHLAPDADGVYQLFDIDSVIRSGGRVTLAGGAGSLVTSVSDWDSGGTPLAEPSYLQGYPAATNALMHSRDSTQWTTTNCSYSQTLTGLDGTTNGGFVVTKTSAAGGGSAVARWPDFAPTSGIKTAVAWIDKASTTASVCLLQVPTASWVEFNTITLEFIAYGGSGTVRDFKIIDYGTYFKAIYQSNYNPNPNISGNIIIDTDEPLNSTLGILQIDYFEGKTIAEVEGLAPIFTTTAAVSTAATTYDFDTANHAESGAYFMQVDGIEDVTILDGFISRTGTDFVLTDQTNTSTQPATNGKHNIGFAFAEGSMAINVDGTWAADVVYDGGLLSGALDVFRLAGYAGRIRNIREYVDTDYTALKAIVDGLMLPTSVTGKSVVFDIADNWGYATFMGVRSIEFKRKGVVIALLPVDFTSYSTTEFGVEYIDEFAFDTSRSKVGEWANESWVSITNAITDQRLIVVFNAAIRFDEIVINNAHRVGALTTSGIKNTTITISDDAITDTTYDAPIASSKVLTTLEIPEHVGSNETDDRTVWRLGENYYRRYERGEKTERLSGPATENRRAR